VVKIHAPIEAGITNTPMARIPEVSEVMANHASGADATSMKIRVAPEILEYRLASALQTIRQSGPLKN